MATLRKCYTCLAIGGGGISVGSLRCLWGKGKMLQGAGTVELERKRENG